MNSDLLFRVKYPTNRVPLMLDKIPASSDPDAGPFLVTSSRDFIWVDRAFQGGFLRVAVREESPGAVFLGLVEAIASEGVKRHWGNTFSASKEGVLQAIARFHYYELPNPTLLYGEDFNIEFAPSVDRVPAEWLPSGWAVMVPDREYVGTLFEVGDKHVGAVSHNPSRGVVVLR